MTDLTRLILVILLILFLIVYILIRFKMIGGKLSKKKIKLANDFFEKSTECEASGDYKGMLSALNRAIKNNPNQAEYYLFRSQAYEKLDEFQKAIDDVTYAMVLKPDNVEMYEQRKNIYKQLNELKLAYDDAKHISFLNPNSIQACLEAAEIAILMNNEGAALFEYNNALKIAAKLEDAKMVRMISEKIRVLQIKMDKKDKE